MGDSTSTGSPDRLESHEDRAGMNAELHGKVQESNQEVKKLQDNIATLKELHKAELEELRKEVEKQVLLNMYL